MNRLQIVVAAVMACCPALVAAAQLLVLNKDDSTLAFIDPESGQTLATVPTGEGPHEIALSGDGRLAFVSNYGAKTAGNSLSVIDVNARAERQRVDLGELKRPHGLAFSDGRLYLTSEVARLIARFDPATQRVEWTFPTEQNGTHMVLASRDGSKLFATNLASKSVSVIERTNGVWQQTLVRVGMAPEGFDLSPDGREIWAAHAGDGGISIIDVGSKKVIHSFDAKTKRSNRLKFSQDGKLVLVSEFNGGNLVVLDARERIERARLPVGNTPSGILIAPDGRHAYVAVSGDNRIAVVDLKALRVERTIETGKSPDGMAWVN